MAFTQDVSPRTPVRSEPLENGKAVGKKAPNGGMWALSIVLLIFGVIGWIAGGKYTVEGWVIALNMFGRWIGIQQQLSVPRGWWLVGAVILSGVIYSKVETQVLQKRAQRMPSFWMGWLFIVFTDVGSTFLGVLNPAADAPPVFLQLASVWPLAVLWAMLLTFVPEWLILSGTKLFRR